MAEEGSASRPEIYKGRLPPPMGVAGPVAWAKENLFSSPLNIALTFLSVFLLYKVVPPLASWAFIDATWTFPPEVLNGQRPAKFADCAPDGACWLFVRMRIGQFIFGFYPAGEQWRVVLSFIIGIVGIYGLLGGLKQYRKVATILVFIVFPIASFWLLRGGLGLVPVPTEQWGGFMLTLVIALVGIVLSLPFGIFLALGRRSKLPIIRMLCVIFIEFVRAVPLITVIFMANIMLPLFLPADVDMNVLLRVLVGTTAFASAYMAEAVRGGLQAIPKGQSEAAAALGLGYWSRMRLVILPQALRVSIPSIVNTFIAFFKDTTLVSMVGLYDFLNMVKAGFRDPNWVGVEISGYAFCAVVYWICCFSMSRYSMHLEGKLHTATRDVEESSAMARKPQHKPTASNADNLRFVDLSHTIENGMITYKGLPAPLICDHLSRLKSREVYAEGTEFQIGKIEMVANTGTYIDMPFHRYADGHDLAGLPLERVSDVPGVLVRVAGLAGRAIDWHHFEPMQCRGHAVLVHTGWDRHWRTDQYFENHPFLTEKAALYLREQGALLVGIDSLNIDDTSGGTRPVHSVLLGANIPVVEHLTGLEALPPSGFRISAVPPKIRGMGTFPVRAHARIT